MLEETAQTHKKLREIVEDLVQSKYHYLPYDTRQDLCQEGHIGAWKALSRANDHWGSPYRYLRTAAQFAMLAFLRTQGQLLAGQDNKRPGPRPIIVPAEEGLLPYIDPAFEAVENRITVERLLRELPSDVLRNALRAHLSGRTHAETAAHIGVRPNTIQYRTQKAILLLRAHHEDGDH